MDLEELKQAEERKRDAAYDPVRRWAHVQATITWAEAQMPPHRRRNRPRRPAALPLRETSHGPA